MDLLPLDISLASMGMDVIHDSNGKYIPAFIMICRHPSCVCGDYSLLPYIQYLDENGDVYGVKSRPEWLSQYMPVNPNDLLVINDKQQQAQLDKQDAMHA